MSHVTALMSLCKFCDAYKRSNVAPAVRENLSIHTYFKMSHTKLQKTFLLHVSHHAVGVDNYKNWFILHARPYVAHTLV